MENIQPLEVKINISYNDLRNVNLKNNICSSYLIIYEVVRLVRNDNGKPKPIK